MHVSLSLEEYGWNAFLEAIWSEKAREKCVPGRVVSQQRGFWNIVKEERESLAEASGNLRHAAELGADWPAVGDWVAAEQSCSAEVALIHEVLPRKSRLGRKAAGKRVQEQVVASNVDTILLVSGLDGDFNLRRMERHLAQCWESGARPVIVLNKADLCLQLEQRLAEMERIAWNVPVVALSAHTGNGMESLSPFLAPGQTLVLLGSSGVGKSTLVNRLLGEDVQSVQPTRQSDSRGRHTTTVRQLFRLPCGALIIDTPGLRELQLWDATDGLAQAFADLEALAAQCRFRNCRHESEPGCAVQAALVNGSLDEERLENRRKLEREQAFLLRKMDAGARGEAKQRAKTIHRQVRKLYERREREHGKP
jgi:ribosome biogenesis GTPase / thiamine phosphate phosphatase